MVLKNVQEYVADNDPRADIPQLPVRHEQVELRPERSLRGINARAGREAFVEKLKWVSAYGYVFLQAIGDPESLSIDLQKAASASYPDWFPSLLEQAQRKSLPLAMSLPGRSGQSYTLTASDFAGPGKPSSKELMRRVRIRAAETDREIRDIVIEALETFLGAKPKKGGKA